MAELRTVDVAVVTALATPEAIDAIDGAYRIAPDEAMLVAEPTSIAADLVERAGTAARAVDPDALVLDTTDGWTAVDLRGNDARDALARLSHLEIPDTGFVQGDVAHIGIRVIAEPTRLRLLVPAMWAHYLEERLTELAEVTKR